jgi:hypothetical protein
MKLVDNILYIEFSDFLTAGWKEDTIKKANLRNGCNWVMINNPKDKRKPLVQYDFLINEHKTKLQNRFGNPYEWVVKEPIKMLLENDPDAEKFFFEYKYGPDNNTLLPIKKVKQYIRASRWLKMLNKVQADIKTIKEKLGINIPTLYRHVTDMMALEKINGDKYLYEIIGGEKVRVGKNNYDGPEQLPADFGTSYKRLLEKQAAFKANSYTSVIDKMYGNQLAAKIKDEVSEARLLTYIEDGRQFDDVMIAMMYNVWASENGYKTITSTTVGEWRRKKESSIMMGRSGNNAMNEKYIRQVKGFRPTAPLFLVEHDDNNFDLLFNSKDEKGNVDYQFNKYVGIVVRDAAFDLVLGKSYRMAQSPVAEMIYHAYLDAMYYIRSLTGGWYLPFEIKSDRWAGTTLNPFYDKVAKFVKPAKGNKHRGYIEQSFGNNHWDRCMKLVSDGNYSGNNMTAKYRGVNPDMLDNRVQAKSGPSIGNEAETMIENFFTMLRHMPDFTREQMNAPSKEQKWLAAWEQLPLDKKRPITDEQFFLIFGIKHQPQSRTITITNRGVEPKIMGKKYSYDLPEAWMYNDLIGSNVSVYYDPYDMSRVLITDGNQIRFIAKEAQLVPRALQDTYTGSRTFLNAILAEKKDQVVKAATAAAKRKQLHPTGFNAEAMLQGGVLIKELKNAAEQRMIEETQTTQHENFLDENYDFSQYQ